MFDSMPEILASINPEWIEHIFCGIKLYEVRKNKPSTPLPFKVLIYCTKNGRILFKNRKGTIFTTPFTAKNLLTVHPDAEIFNGKIVGEFVCDKVVEVPRGALYNNYNASSEIMNAMYYSCVTNNELIRYCGSKKSLFFWHITNLVIYDTPKELSDFGLNRPPQSYQFVLTNKENTYAKKTKSLAHRSYAL